MFPCEYGEVFKKSFFIEQLCRLFLTCGCLKGKPYYFHWMQSYENRWQNNTSDFNNIHLHFFKKRSIKIMCRLELISFNLHLVFLLANIHKRFFGGRHEGGNGQNIWFKERKISVLIFRYKWLRGVVGIMSEIYGIYEIYGILSIFSPNAGKGGLKLLLIRTLFTHCGFALFQNTKSICRKLTLGTNFCCKNSEIRDFKKFCNL